MHGGKTGLFSHLHGRREIGQFYHVFGRASGFLVSKILFFNVCGHQQVVSTKIYSFNSCNRLGLTLCRTQVANSTQKTSADIARTETASSIKTAEGSTPHSATNLKNKDWKHTTLVAVTANAGNYTTMHARNPKAMTKML